VEVGGVAEDQVDAEADGHGFGVQGVFEQRLDFGGVEEFLEGVAAGEDAIAEGLDVVVGFLAGDEGGDEQQRGGCVPGIEQGLDAFGRVFDDVEDEAEVHHIGGLFRLVRGVDRVPAVGGVAELRDRLDIAAVAAAVVEEGFAAAELAEFEQGLDRLGDLAADQGGLVAVDFLLRRFGRGRFGGAFGFNEPMAFEREAAVRQEALPVQAEADA
jgi:hypothetical protein